jgi:hypothetical protein
MPGGPLANRHREQALARCRDVLPGPPARPQPPKTAWRERLQSFTGIDPTRCEVCGEKAVRLVGEMALARAGRECHPMIYLLMHRWQYSVHSAAETGNCVSR